MGAGAIGCVVGGLLTEAGQDVTFLDQWPEHVEAMKQRGLRLTGTCGDRLVRVQALHLYEAQAIQRPFEAVFLSVKGYDTDWAALFAARFLAEPDGYLVVFQNGLNDERVARLVGRQRTLGCVITIRAGLYEPGVATRTDAAPVGFTVGELEGPPTERVQRLVEVLNTVIPSRATPNLAGERWSKLAVNCLANPLAGLSGYSTADVLIQPAPRAIAIHIAAEVIRVARAAGHEVEPIFSIEPQRYVDAAEGGGRAGGGHQAEPRGLQEAAPRQRHAATAVIASSDWRLRGSGVRRPAPWRSNSRTTAALTGVGTPRRRPSATTTPLR